MGSARRCPPPPARPAGGSRTGRSPGGSSSAARSSRSRPMTLIASAAVTVLLGATPPLRRPLPDGIAQLVYLDPPFNTGATQRRATLRTVADEDGTRTGFGGRRYRSELLERSSYRDHFDDYLAFLEPRLAELRRVLHVTGTLYFHIDHRESHY